jgi:hypothetical protein
VIVERVGAVDAGVLAAGIAVVHERDLAPARRWASAIRRASRTRVVRMWDANCQPTILRLNTSITNAKKTSPYQQRR